VPRRWIAVNRPLPLARGAVGRTGTPMTLSWRHVAACRLQRHVAPAISSHKGRAATRVGRPTMLRENHDSRSTAILCLAAALSVLAGFYMISFMGQWRAWSDPLRGVRGWRPDRRRVEPTRLAKTSLARLPGSHRMSAIALSGWWPRTRPRLAAALAGYLACRMGVGSAWRRLLSCRGSTSHGRTSEQCCVSSPGSHER
jgi:hypothetical protein